METAGVQKPIKRLLSGRESGRQLSGFLGMGAKTGEVAQASTQDAADFGSGALVLGINLLSMAAFISAAVISFVPSRGTKRHFTRCSVPFASMNLKVWMLK